MDSWQVEPGGEAGVRVMLGTISLWLRVLYNYNYRGVGVLMEGFFLKKIVHTIQDTTGAKVGR